jgi:hypothetical protein
MLRFSGGAVGLIEHPTNATSEKTLGAATNWNSEGFHTAAK